MSWIFFSLIYAIFNAVYLNYNSKHHFDGYILGMVRGFGIFLCALPFCFLFEFELSGEYMLILVLQGLMIGIYDSHIFFSSSLYGGHSTSGFMAISVVITLISWWVLSFNDLEQLLKQKTELLTLCFIILGLTVSYWQMMKVHINSQAEKYLYPAVFSLAFMSIATRYIALSSKTPYQAVILYLIISGFVSGVYNLVLFIFYNYPKNSFNNKLIPSLNSMLWIVFFSSILITAKTLALRIAYNPSYVVAMLLLSPLIADVIKNKSLKLKFEGVVFIIFMILLIIFSFY